MKVIHVLEDLCHGCGACTVACTYNAITEHPMPLGVVSSFSLNGCECLVEARMKIGAMSPVAVIRAAVDKAGKEDGTVILDSPPGTACPFIHTVSSADYVILVTEPTPFGLSDLQQSVETLKTLKKSYGAIINRSGNSDGQMESYLKKERIPLLLEIPFDREIARIYSGGGMVVEEFPDLEKEFLSMVTKLIT
jgi:MinD superfamily P-loop ATPase